MFEILKLLVDVLAKVLNPAELIKLRHQAGEEKLATDLLAVYLALDDILTTGLKIVERLERGSADGEGSPGDLAPLAEAQIKAIRTVVAAMDAYDLELRTVDAGTHRQCRTLVGRKMGALDLLRRSLRSGIPLGNEALERAMLRGREMQVWHEFPETTVHFRAADGEALVWDESTRKIVATYLNIRRPQEQLAEFEASLLKLRTALAEILPLRNALLRIGDPKHHL